MPTLKRNTFLLIFCALTFISCDPPEFKENIFHSSFQKDDSIDDLDLVKEILNKNEDEENNEPKNLKKTQIGNLRETFFQIEKSREKVDILWVVDNSGSMEDEQGSLARNFDLFIEEFLEKDIDFKMAVTTTDPYLYGKAVGGISGLETIDAKNNESEFLDEFTGRIRVGIKGHGKEQGLRTSVSFLNRYGNLFLRKDAFLVVIYVSDENDQSPYSLDSIYKNLMSLKSKSNQVKIFSIVNQKGRSYPYYESAGERYCYLSKKTGGLCSNIKDDFSQILKNFGKKIAELKNIFLLRKRPNGREIKVYVQGEKLDSGWLYEEGMNAIKFEEASLPEEGEKIEVLYTYKIQGS